MPEYMADISSNNGPRFNPVQYRSAGHSFVMLKATEDIHYVNPYYATWVHQAHMHGLCVIHYHFSRPENGNPRAQADHFWQTIKTHVRRPGDFISFDVETDVPKEAALWLVEADAFIRHISGWLPWAYSPLSYVEQGNIRVGSKQLHIAAWGNDRPGNRLWQFGGQRVAAWQFTDGRVGPLPHAVAGIPGVVDCSIVSPRIVRQVKRQLNRRIH